MAVSMTRRRFLSQAGTVALAAGVGSTLLEACGGSSSSGPVTLTYGWWSNGPTKDNGMKAWIKEFEKVNKNITVQPEILSWQDYWNKLQTTVAGGKAYDIVGMAGGMAAPYFDQRALYDLNKFSDFQSATKNLIPSAVQMCSWNGQQNALPVGIYVPLIGYNKSLLQKAKVPFPDPITPMDFEAFKTIARKLSIKSGSQYTQYAININDLDPLWTELAQMEGGQVYDNPINPKKVLVNSPAGIKGLTDWQSLYTENLAVPLAQQGNGPFGAGDIDSLLTDKVAFSRIVLADFAQIVNEKLEDKIGVMPIFSVNGKQVTCGNANSFGIFADSKHPQEAWTFIKWATSAGQKGFAQISDIPVDQAAFNDMGSYLQPADFAKTLIAAQKGFQPIVMTPNQQYGTDLGNILTDLSTGKLTPAAAAQQIEQRGNTLFASAS
ncbi:MAG TPA: sugar ABC transporter substrate-binding protein [Ktedonobacteraceae bacterium]|nr:sugar ABC transporter substrate-binding protein [Ktedonobacteraceae bacterium]